MKQEVNNIFSDGLVQDLNPINTPNTVLTDNLNGTIITYNGNEHMLQNDRGNYELKYCKLKPNYIPVGVKEYGDTIYIVSYNPIDGNTEIGSYPSPMDVDSIENPDQQIIISSIVQNAISPGKKYSDLVKDIKSCIFDSDDFKIYPGDEYQLNIQDRTDYPYEELEYFIIDEEKNKYNISKNILENNDFSSVSWTSPGWLGAQYRLWSFDEFKLNLRSITVPSLLYNTTGSLFLNFQFLLSDPSLIARLQSNINDLNIQLEISHNGRVIQSPILSHKDLAFKWLVNTSSTTIWANYEIQLDKLNPDDSINIVATPIISFFKDGVKYEIKYDLQTSKLSYVLDSLGSFNDYSMCSDLWKFWVEKTNPDQLLIEMDINGPIVSKGDVKLYYTIHEIDENLHEIISPEEPGDSDEIKCPNCGDTNILAWNICGNCGYQLSDEDVTPKPDVNTCPNCGGNEFENDICVSCGYKQSATFKLRKNINLKYHPIDSYHLGKNVFILDFNSHFKSENIYVIEFVLTNNDILRGDNLTNFYSHKKLIITSKVFESFINTYNNFDNITFDEWSEKYFEIYKNDSTCELINMRKDDNTLSKVKIGDWSREAGLIQNSHNAELIVDDELRKFWTTNDNTGIDTHTTFVSDSAWNHIKDKKTDFLRGYTRNITGDVKILLPNGELTKSLNENCEIQFLSHGYTIKDPIKMTSDKFEKSVSLKTYEVGKCSVSYKNASGRIVKGSLSDSNYFEYLLKKAPEYAVIYGYGHDGSGSNNYTKIDIWTSSFGIDRPSSEGTPQYSDNKRSELPNTASEYLLNWLNSRQQNIGLVFLTGKIGSTKKGVALHRSDNQNEPIFNITGSTTTNIMGQTVEIQKMIPAIVVKNGNVPLLFLIKGFDNAIETDPNVLSNHINRYRYLSDLRDKIKSGLQNIIYLNIDNLVDGMFLTTECLVDSRLVQDLKLKLTLNQTYTWDFKKYNLLNIDHRKQLYTSLQNKYAIVSNLLNGQRNKLDKLNLIEYNYNKIESSDDAITEELETLRNVLTNELNNLTMQHWYRWQNCALYNNAQYQTSVSGLDFINNTTETNKLKNSNFFDLLQQYYLQNKLLDFRVYSDVTLSYEGFANNASPFPFAKLHPSILIP